jgi:tripartite-type tricarboxylate transporter receptor subunit TctC
MRNPAPNLYKVPRTISQGGEKTFCKRLFGVIASVLLVLGLAQPGMAAGFPEKDITFIIPYSTGGGFDRTVRRLIPYMEKYLPNKVNVIPKNVPGAGGRKGVATMYRSDPDGYTIAIFNIPGMAIPVLTGTEVEYDLDKVTWLARLATADYMMGVGGSSSIKSLDDLKKLDSAKFPQTGAGSTASAVTRIATAVLGINATHLTGYKGSKEYTLGVIRGDGEAAFAPVTSFRQYVESGDIRPILTFESESSMPGVPTAREIGFPELETLALERLVGGPPAMPADVAKILSDAMIKAMNDPELIEAAAKEPFAPLAGDVAGDRVTKSLAFYAKYKSILAAE